jgi:hypothetical protein
MILDNIYNLIFIFLITVIIAYIFGLSLVNVIDDRLNKINIEQSKNNELNKPIENFVSENKREISEYKTYDFNKGNVIKNKNNFDAEYYNQMSKDSRVEGFSNNPSDSYKGWSIEQKKTQTCIKNHIHKKDGKDMNCTYGITNYADPKDMSPMDYKIFNLNYPSNLTLQDYINWLYCYIDKEDELPYNHLKNLEKLKLGKELIEEHGVCPPPGYNYPPMTSESYFDKMYNGVNEFSTASPLNSNTGAMLGYNYNEYSEFSQNMDLNGSTGVIRNTDIALKKDAKKLYNYVNPKDSNSLNIDNETQIYRMKNVEI